MKKYRIKPFGRNEEIGRVVFQDDGQVFMKLNIAPKQIYILDLIDNTDFFNDVKQVFPNAEIKPVEEDKKDKLLNQFNFTHYGNHEQK